MDYIDITNKSALLFAINATAQIKGICEPLQNYLGISCFGYLKIYNDCSYISLMNGFQGYQRKYFTHIKSLDPYFHFNLRISPYNQAKCFLWPTKYKKLYPIMALLKEYNIWHGFSISYRYKDYCELFYFAFDKDENDKAQFYVQNSQLLEKFCNYFKTQAADLIDDSDKSKLAVYQDKFDTSYLEGSNGDRQQFLNEINSAENSFLINKSRSLINLTPRESECISIYMQNRTIKEIGKFLNLSPRTVERHIENVKKKLGVNYKSQLVDIFSNIYIG